MAESSSLRIEKANSRCAKPCPPKGNSLHQILPFERWARSVWPVKPTSNLRAVIGRSIRTCKYRMAGVDPDYIDVVAILRSDYGFSFLDHIMGDATPAWWRGIKKTRSLSTMRKQLDEQRRRIEQLELEIE